MLCGSEAFRERAAIVREEGCGEAAAYREAAAYVAKGLGRRTIAWYLRSAAQARSNLEMMKILHSAGRGPIVPRDTQLAPDAPLRVR
jgi:hypothetical protein